MVLRAAASSNITHPRTQRSPISTAAAVIPPVINKGYFSLLAFWVGGAGA